MTLSLGQAEKIIEDLKNITDDDGEPYTTEIFPNFIHGGPYFDVEDTNSLVSLRIFRPSDLNKLSQVFKIAANHGANNYLIHESAYILLLIFTNIYIIKD